MTAIKFIHTDYFRLASPIQGLANCPAWLQKLAADSVRQATRNVIDTAIAENVDFLFIAGSVSESLEDQASVGQWLAEQFALLRQRGIRIVAHAETPHQATLLQSICDVVLQRQCLSVGFDHSDELQFHVGTSNTTADQLLISIGDLQRQAAALHYTAEPSLSPCSDQDQVSHNGQMAVSAGAVQALSSSEAWKCGCVVVDADLAARTIHTSFVETDVIRFSTEELKVGGLSSAHDLVSEILDASSSLQNRTRTWVVDWVVSADLVADARQVNELSGDVLLSTIRHQLHGGHYGVWPRKISFSRDSKLTSINGADFALTEYAAMLIESQEHNRLNRWESSVAAPMGHRGVGGELLAGLGLLGRVA